MPMELVTGLPGHGKTLYTLWMVKARAEREGRPVFFHGIKDLKLPWRPWEPDNWRNLEAGSIMVIDECQDVFPVRGRERPPEWIEELAKHRHRGIDLVFITQNPMLMDSFVRRLIDRHFHVVRVFGLQRATVHEFANGVREQVARSREGSIRHEWSFPKDAFEWYTSAELHTVKRRIPMRVWIMLCTPLVFLGFAYAAYMRLRPSSVAAAPAAATFKPGAAWPGAAGAVPPGQPRGLAPDAYLRQFAPRVDGLAYTAPAYDRVTEPVVAPFPAACVSSSTRCSCYSQQATALEMPQALCREIAARGFFVAWQSPGGGMGQGRGQALPGAPNVRQGPPPGGSAAPSEAVSVPVLAGEPPRRTVRSADRAYRSVSGSR